MPVKYPGQPARDWAILEKREHLRDGEQPPAVHQTSAPSGWPSSNLMPTKIRDRDASPAAPRQHPPPGGGDPPPHWSRHPTRKNHRRAPCRDRALLLLRKEDSARESSTGLGHHRPPVEQMPFEDVDYWPRASCGDGLAKTNVLLDLLTSGWAGPGRRLTTTIGVPKYPLPEKIVRGLSPTRERAVRASRPRLRTTSSTPPSRRHTEIRREDVLRCRSSSSLRVGGGGGLHHAVRRPPTRVRDRTTRSTPRSRCRASTVRRRGQGLPIAVPRKLLSGDDPRRGAGQCGWRGHAASSTRTGSTTTSTSRRPSTWTRSRKAAAVSAAHRGESPRHERARCRGRPSAIASTSKGRLLVDVVS